MTTRRVVSTPLGRAFDLLAAYEAPDGFHLEREGLGVVASPERGGWRLGPERDLAALARATSNTLHGLHDGGVAPVAVGALRFDGADASLWVPARAVLRADAGDTWLLDLAGDAEPQPFRPERVIGDLPHGAFGPMQLTEEPPGDVYSAAVAEATASIGRGDLAKVVLARTLRVDAGRVLDPRRLLHRLRAVEPHCFTFAAPTPAGVLVGASPELLVSRRGDRVRSTPLAGTAPRAGDPDEDVANAEALAASAKNREEHAIVVEAVADVLGGFCDDLSFDPEPSLEPTANVWHLATRFAGTLRDPSVSALDVVAELHPTPAVCGAPSAAAVSAISALEPFDRGMYAGPLGWVDAGGDGDWVIALRCAALDGERATLYAGAGIVAGSDPASEVDETERKFRAFLDSLRWG